ncbi:hypothetical protein P389DRAFT_181773 [Cystobasidium minutum MCA 4210]|uniref:uncharacterized protein n=1 Tax=Cystobasidium minutum MCA 4210 TaxID=1397322 RepID=UPI0034CDF0F7|eukprot:jgi/Rhomi1/181773/fgenesh1_pg.8_\
MNEIASSHLDKRVSIYKLNLQAFKAKYDRMTPSERESHLAAVQKFHLKAAQWRYGIFTHDDGPTLTSYVEKLRLINVSFFILDFSPAYGNLPEYVNVENLSTIYIALINCDGQKERLQSFQDLIMRCSATLKSLRICIPGNNLSPASTGSVPLFPRLQLLRYTDFGGQNPEKPEGCLPFHFLKIVAQASAFGPKLHDFRLVSCSLPEAIYYLH